jgi:2-amino-4-hydroxy-6-hydroxymethyldihydropteridine diphosphokinase
VSPPKRANRSPHGIRRASETPRRLIHIGLGANLGNAEGTIKAALAAVSAWANQFEPLAEFKPSRLFRSTSIGAPGPDYINAIAEFYSSQGAETILSALQAMELSFGRTRPFPNAPRTLDLDLLLVGSESIDLPHLVVPHPRMNQRAFVLKPLAELQPGLSIEGRSIQDLLQQCAGQNCEPVSEEA